jgi:hypothetical protein
MAKTSELPAGSVADAAHLVVVQDGETRLLDVEEVLGEAKDRTDLVLQSASDLMLYDPAGDVVPLWVDANYGVLLGINKVSGEPVGQIITRIAAMIAAARA